MSATYTIKNDSKLSYVAGGFYIPAGSTLPGLPGASISDEIRSQIRAYRGVSLVNDETGDVEASGPDAGVHAVFAPELEEVSEDQVVEEEAAEEVEEEVEEDEEVEEEESSDEEEEVSDDEEAAEEVDDEDDGRCNADTASGSRCKRNAIDGTEYCSSHTPQED